MFRRVPEQQQQQQQKQQQESTQQQQQQYVHFKVIPVTRGVTVSLSRSLQTYLEDGPRQQSNTAEDGYPGKNKMLRKIQK
jgi:hypothetical protein